MKKSMLQFVKSYSYVFFLLPALIMFYLFIAGPIYSSIALSFFAWEGFGEPYFVGWNNYRELWADSRFWQCMYNNMIWFFSAWISPILALGMALLVQQSNRYQRLLKSIFFYH